MSEELARTRKALGEAIACLQQLSTLGGTTSIGNDKAREGLAKVQDILEPPPEFEEVEVVRWYNIYPLTGGFHLDCTHGFATREEADNDASTDRIDCQELRVKVKRPVKRVVVKEVSVEAVIGGRGASKPHLCEGDAGGLVDDCPFTPFPECHGKTGKLIFQWTE